MKRKPISEGEFILLHTLLRFTQELNKRRGTHTLNIPFVDLEKVLTTKLTAAAAPPEQK